MLKNQNERRHAWKEAPQTVKGMLAPECCAFVYKQLQDCNLISEDKCVFLSLGH